MKILPFTAVVALAAVSACATKTFPTVRTLDAATLNAMTCQDLAQELALLKRHEKAVDEEAESGNWKPFLFGGGVWSVMADNDLERESRKKIQKRARLLYDAKVKKGCS